MRWLAASTVVLAMGPAAAHAVDYVEPPFLAGRVAAGELPPVANRLPQPPLVVAMTGPDRQIGRYGGAIRMLAGRARDVRMMVVYGYARLVAYDETFAIVPDIVESVTVEAGRRFTFRLRRGHRWSDGNPFTAEDFRYYWEDVANHRELSPAGIPRELMVDGEAARFEVVDPITVRYSWSNPNPHFLPALAGSAPLYIYRPAHYLKPMHSGHADAEKLDRQATQARQRGWAALHNRMDNQYQNDNPALPTLDPWVARTNPPAQSFVFDRNPYFHRVDTAGHQLPYADQVKMAIVAPNIIPLKSGSGETDLQARGLNFSDYTFLKEGEKSGDYSVRLWPAAKGAHVALFPNLNATDPVWRKLLRDVRFRRALSLGIDRHEINQVAYFGLAIEGNNTVLPASPLYRPEYRESWTAFDLKQANALLDALGLDKRNSRGLRLLPDGRPMEIVIETASEDGEQTDVLELIHDSWLKCGIKIYTRPSQREVFRNRIFAGQTLISVWSGIENGLPHADTSPEELAPTSQQQLQWPKWGQYSETRGHAGEPVDLPAAAELAELNRAWRTAASTEARGEIWRRMLAIHADQAFTIGVVAGVLQPVVVGNRLRNVPRKGVYNWEPGAHFGVYRPDAFWLAAEPAGAPDGAGAASERR